jgi:hypothetical protein
VEIENFQCHENLELELHGGATIVGESDAGKSAVLRAIIWVMTNSPSGLAMLRHGEKSVRVRITVDGHVVERERSKSKNVYRLDGAEYVAFGADVPDPVARVLSVSALSIQRQHDPPYLLAANAGEAARELARVVDLDVIDRTRASVARERRAATAAVDSVAPECDRLADQIVDGRAWEDRDLELMKIESQDIRLGAVEGLARDLDELVGGAEIAARRVAPREVRDAAINWGQGLSLRIAAQIGMTTAIDALRAAVDRAQHAARFPVERVKAFVAAGEVEGLGFVVGGEVARGRNRSDLQAAIQAATQARADMISAQRLLTSTRTLVYSARVDWRAAEPECPTCGNPW